MNSSVEGFALRLPPQCKTCGKRVESIVGEPSFNDDSYRLTLRCHGASEVHLIPRSALHRQDLSCFPVVAFLRSVASHGQVSAAARRERRMAR